MSVTEKQLIEYVEVFHATLDETASQFFDAEQAKNLHYQLLIPARIICYVSTQFGVAFEYVPATSTSIESVKGSARIEDLLVRAPKSLRNVGPLFKISASNITITEITLADAFPFRLSSQDASLTLQNVRCTAEALNWNREIGYAEIYSDRSPEKWSEQAAASRAKDEILAALFVARQAEASELELFDFLSEFREKGVLVLGTYDSEGEQRLASISECLSSLGYIPFLLKEVPDFPHYDLSQKAVVAGSISRFVVVDDSSPSGHLAEVELCRSNRWITVLLRAGGRAASLMTVGASIASNVILEKDYDPLDPSPAVAEAVEWVEEKLQEVKLGFSQVYPWRSAS